MLRKTENIPIYYFLNCKHIQKHGIIVGEIQYIEGDTYFESQFSSKSHIVIGCL